MEKEKKAPGILETCAIGLGQSILNTIFLIPLAIITIILINITSGWLLLLIIGTYLLALTWCNGAATLIITEKI